MSFSPVWAPVNIQLIAPEQLFFAQPHGVSSTHVQICIQPKIKGTFLQISGTIAEWPPTPSTLLYKFLPPRLPWVPISVSPIQQNCRLCLGSLLKCYRPETAHRKQARVTAGLTSFVPFFLGITVLGYLLPNVWKQLFKIFCPVPSCLQGMWGRREQVLSQLKLLGLKWKSQSLLKLSHFKGQTPW